MKIKTLGLYLGICSLLPGAVPAADTTNLLMIAPPAKKTIAKAMPLLAKYLSKKVDGIESVRPVIPKSYNDTGRKFESGDANAMYSGSFLSYILCARGLAVPVARGEEASGVSTYHSVLVAKKGTPFTGLDSVQGKRVTYVTEASSGEAFARKFFGGREPASVGATQYVPSKSHGIAVKQVEAGRADFAFVKNLVWQEIRRKYPDLHQVATDDGENPNHVFLVSKPVYAAYGKQLRDAFLGMESDPSPLAKKILVALRLKRFIPTPFPEAYSHTAQLVSDASIDPLTHRFAK